MDGTPSVTNPPSLSLGGGKGVQLQPVGFSSSGVVNHHQLLLHQQSEIKTEDDQPLPIGNEHADPDSRTPTSAFSYAHGAFLGNDNGGRNCSFYDHISIGGTKPSDSNTSGERVTNTLYEMGFIWQLFSYRSCCQNTAITAFPLEYT